MAALILAVFLGGVCAGCLLQIAWDRYIDVDPDTWSIREHRKAMRRLREARRWN